MNKAIFLDRDGTINREKKYVFKIEDFEINDGVIEGLKQLQDAGFILIVITNQSGIARGYYDENDFHKLNDWMTKYFLNYGIKIAHTYYCPHLPNSKISLYNQICNCRKPELGLFLQAINDYNIDLSKSFAIGDKNRDLEICKKSDCRGFQIMNSNECKAYENIENVKNFMEAVHKILKLNI